MAKLDNKNAQAGTELAVFGAILIFILGTILQSAVGNSYSQNQNLKAMRMAMLTSWQGSIQQPANTSHNSPSILFVEDRLSPDFSKYGSLQRTPLVANGSGSFSYQLLYPLDASEVNGSLPIMDVYINGQHFPLTTAAYVQDHEITWPPPACTSQPPAENPPFTIAQCVQNQCLRNQREWMGLSISSTIFQGIVPSGAEDPPDQAQTNADTIFTLLVNAGIIAPASPATVPATGSIVQNYTPDLPAFVTAYDGTFPSKDAAKQINDIETILEEHIPHKLFYTLIPNGVSEFTLKPPPPCTKNCNNKALTSDLVMTDSITNSPVTNTSGDFQYDLLRNGNYVNSSDPSAVETALPLTGCGASTCSLGNASSCMRCDIAWQWAATEGIPYDSNNNGVNVDANNNSYPTYDFDGRLKESTIYAIAKDKSSGATAIDYLDNQGGDMDSTWDSNSCSPKPGLSEFAQVYTFTGTGTYLQIKEGKLYNTETGQVVRSADKRDNVDLIKRQLQLSNDTYRFCDGVNEKPPSKIGRCLLVSDFPKTPRSGCSGTSTGRANGDGTCCSPSAANNYCNCGAINSGAPMTYDGDPNPVEVCIPQGSSDTCNSHFTQTCFDESSKVLYISSRLQDLRGNSWITNASGQLRIQ